MSDVRSIQMATTQQRVIRSTSCSVLGLDFQQGWHDNLTAHELHELYYDAPTSYGSIWQTRVRWHVYFVPKCVNFRRWDQSSVVKVNIHTSHIDVIILYSAFATLRPVHTGSWIIILCVRKQMTLYPETGDFVAENGDKVTCFRIQSHMFPYTKYPVSITSVDRPLQGIF